MTSSLTVSSSTEVNPPSTSIGVPAPVEAHDAKVVGTDFATGGVPPQRTVAFANDNQVTGAQQNDNKDYFSRPRQIASYTWSTSATSANFGPWSNYFSAPELRNRYHYLNLFKGDMVVRFVINGTPFNYGLDIAAYFPRYEFNDGDGTAATSVVQCLQRHHVELDPSSVNSQDLRLPFVLEQPFLGISSQSATAFADMGTIFVSSLTNMQSTATASPAALTVSVYAWLEEMTVGGPTPVLFTPAAPGPSKSWQAMSKLASGHESGSGPVSSVASAVATAAGALKGVPLLSAGATAVEVAAKAASSLATFLGFSRPLVVDPPSFMRPQMTGPVPHVLSADTAMSLTLDPRQGVPVSGMTYGFSAADEMAYAYITSRWGLITQFNWAQNSTVGAALTVVGVSPCNTYVASGTYYPTPVAYLALPHTYWTGGLEYRVKVVATQYHSGRMLIRYVPYAGSGGYTVEPYTTSAADCCVLDLSTEQEILLQVPWCSASVVLPTGQAFIAEYTYDYRYANGYLEFIALSPLQAPLPTAQVTVNVWVRGSSDLQLLVPDLSTVRNYTASGPDPLGREAIITPRVCRLTAGVVRDFNPLQQVVGEDAPSVRALVKRYVADCVADPLGGAIIVANQTYISDVVIDQRPFDALRTSIAGASIATGFVGYFGKMYLGARGGMRYKVFSVPAGTTTYTDHTLFAGRVKTTAGTQVGVATLDNPGDVLDIWYAGSSRGIILNKNLQGALEFTLPDYQPTLFRPTWHYGALAAPYDQADAADVTWVVSLGSVVTAGFPFLSILEAASEDFSFFWFQGCPRMTPA